MQTYDELTFEFANSLGLNLRKNQSYIENFNEKFEFLEKTLDLKRSFRSLVGVKEIDSPAYKIRDDYKRFNQKNNLTIGRPSWDPKIKKIIKPTVDNIKSLAEKDTPGYRLVDRALADGAGTIHRTFETNINYPNSGFLQWSPLRKPTYERIGSDNKDNMDIERFTEMIKKIALWFGASLVGITNLDRRWVFSHWYDNRSSPHRNPRIVFSDEKGFEKYQKPTQLKDGTQIIPKEMKYVISLGFEMDYESMNTAPTVIAQAGTEIYGYRTIIQTVASLAEFIRGLGFNAIPSSNDTALSVPIAIDAGLGEDARYGGLITPEFGPRLRLAKVITDLPLLPNKPITFGLHDFCEQCNKCARECTAKAIPFGPRTDGIVKNDVGAPTISESIGPLRWIVNRELCRAYWADMGTNCGICVRVCPWNKPNGILYSISKWFVINGGRLTRRAFIKMDDMLNYGDQADLDKWWTKIKSK